MQQLILGIGNAIWWVMEPYCKINHLKLAYILRLSIIVALAYIVNALKHFGHKR
jgi:hypothetical protein